MVLNPGSSSSRLLDAKSPNIEAARRRDAVARWRRAIADGLTTVRGRPSRRRPAVEFVPRGEERRAEAPAPVAGAPPKDWPPALGRASPRRPPAGFPMWGKARLGPLVRVEGFAASKFEGRPHPRRSRRPRPHPIGSEPAPPPCTPAAGQPSAASPPPAARPLRRRAGRPCNLEAADCGIMPEAVAGLRGTEAPQGRQARG